MINGRSHDAVAEVAVADRPRFSRRGLVFGLGSLMLLVAVIALGLGLVTSAIRRAAVAEFMRDVRRSGGHAHVRRSGSYPGRTYRLNDMSGRLNTAMTRLRAANAVDLSVTALVAEIEASLAKGDSNAVITPIAMLHFLGEGRSDTVAAAYQVGRSKLSSHARGEAIGLLGHLAEEDHDAIVSLGKLLSCKDDGFDRWLLHSAVNELGSLGPTAGDQAPALRDALRAQDQVTDEQGLRTAIMYALSQIGRGATEGLPDLLRIMDDPAESDYVRSQALEAVAAMTIFVGPKTELPHALPNGVKEAVQRLAEGEGDRKLKEQAIRCLAEIVKREGWGQRMAAGWTPSRKSYSAAARKTPSTVTTVP